MSEDERGRARGERVMTEVLEHEPPRPTRRAWAAVGLLVLVLVGAGVEDRRAHASEAAAVARCAAATGEARALADRRVSSMASYVRPALNGSYTPEVRAGLSRLVGEAARDAAPVLGAARVTCARVGVRPWHGDLRGRLDACLQTLDARHAWLEEVAGDGTLAFRSAAEPTVGCAA